MLNVRAVSSYSDRIIQLEGTCRVCSSTSSSKHGQSWGQIRLLWALSRQVWKISIIFLGKLLHCMTSLPWKSLELPLFHLTPIFSCPPAMHCSEEFDSTSLPVGTRKLLLDSPETSSSLGWTSPSPSASPPRASAPVLDQPPPNPDELCQCLRQFVYVRLSLQSPKLDTISSCGLNREGIILSLTLPSVLLFIQLRMLLNIFAARAHFWLVARSFSQSCFQPASAQEGRVLSRALYLLLPNFVRFMLARSSSLSKCLCMVTLPSSVLTDSSIYCYL